MRMFDISEKLALVTGSSRGLGLALTHGLAGAGARVVLHGRNADALREARKSVEAAGGEVAATMTFDVTEQEAVTRELSALMKDVGTPDILVNNTGIQRRAPFADMLAEDWDAVLRTNLSSAFYVSQPIARGMIERGSGKIINIGSVMSALGRETIVPYTASKGGIAMMSKGMAADLARHNIQVNTISPGYFKTEMNSALVEDEEFNAWVIGRTPAKRWGLPEDLVGTLLYLCSDASRYVSGQNIFVDGGLSSVV